MEENRLVSARRLNTIYVIMLPIKLPKISGKTTILVSFKKNNINNKKNWKKRGLGLLVLLLLSVLLLACADQNTAASPTSGSQLTTPNRPGIIVNSTTPNVTDPIIGKRLDDQQAALKQNPPVLTLKDGLDENQRVAQEVAVKNEKFQRYMFAPNSTTPVRTEIFGVYPWRDSDLTDATTICQQTTCYRVELYNFAYNLTGTATVDIKNRIVVATNTIYQAQPDIPDYLKNLAIEIAANAPIVQQQLGFKPTQNQALMANTKTALNNTRCERSLHLCVAPTFVQGGDALWAIVDLTDLTLVGVQWTKVGQSSRLPVSEKNLQDDYVTTNVCQHNTALNQNGWQMDYILTSSDGLRIANVSFNGKAVLANAKLVDWHVSYSRQQGFGYSDAVGCPVFSQAAVVAVGGPRTEPLSQNNGFALIQDFWSIGYPSPCNYNYQQRYEFYNDGRFRIEAASIGRGCGNDGTYRPVTRIRWAGDQNTFAEWNGTGWNDWTAEKWQLQTAQTAYTPEGYQYRLVDQKDQGYLVEPGRGQFGDGGRGDNAYVYITRYHPGIDEGEADLVTLGSCCNTDYHQGPEKFIEPNPEPIAGSGLVMWYVAQLKNDDTTGHEYCWAQSIVENGLLGVKKFPCYSGPLFVPTK